MLGLSTRISTFPCPLCGQTINTTMQQCPFCHVSLDPAASSTSAETAAEVNHAISDAGYTKIVIGVAALILATRFLLLIRSIGIYGYTALEASVPAMVIRWWLRFGKLSSSDADFLSARRTMLLTGGGAVLIFLLLDAWFFLVLRGVPTPPTW